MMWLLAWTALFAAATAIRLTMAWRYATRLAPAGDTLSGRAPSMTVLQPILSGDPALASCLRANVLATPAARFLWLIDRDDAEGLAVARGIAADQVGTRIDIVEVPGPRDGENPKMAKLIAGSAMVTSDVLIVLDDDTVLPPGGADALAVAAMRGGLATGLPVYASTATLAERLVAGFINGQALATYFAMAAVSANRTINGMVYAVAVRELAHVGGFATAGHELTDDYAVARLWRSHGLPLVQTNVSARVVISFDSLRQAAVVVRRWMIFANRYLSRNATPAALALVVMPSLLPALGAIPAALAGCPAALVWPTCLAAKAYANGLLLRRLAGVPPTSARIGFEMLADVLLPAIYAAALVGRRSLTWRTRRIRLTGDRISYH